MIGSFRRVGWLLAITSILLVVVLLMTSSCTGAGRSPSGREQKEPVLTLYFHETGKIQELKMEDYIKGVVAGEMDPSWPVEALGAQAILARTFTLKNIQEGGLKGKNADASTNPEEFQAYKPEKINANVRKAVKLTRGKVITCKGELINGWFHADAGGRTASSAKEGLNCYEGTFSYLKSVQDPGYQILPPENKVWTASFPIDKVRWAISQRLGKDPGPITSVAIVKKGVSGRATRIKLGAVTVNAPELRLVLGTDQMRSTMLKEIGIIGGQLVIKGKGFGHGVGMSQWGAKALAGKGKTSEEILKYFYKHIKVEKRWP